MKKRYLALFLAAAIVLTQTVGAEQIVKASETAEEVLPKEEQEEEKILPEKQEEEEMVLPEKQEEEEKALPAEQEKKEKEKKESVPEEKTESQAQPKARSQKAAEVSPQLDGIAEDLTVLPEEGQELRNDPYTWIYEGETQRFYVERESSEIIWEIGTSDNGEDILFNNGAAGNPVTWKASGNTIAITGEIAQENIFVRARCGDETADSILWLDVRKNVSEVDLGLENEVRVLRGSDTGIGSSMGRVHVENAEYPHGEDFFIKTRNMQSADESIAAVECDRDGDWRVYGKKVGQTAIEVEYYAENGPENILTKNVTVIVTNEEYYIDIVSSTGMRGNADVLFGDSIDLTANITGERWAEDEDGEFLDPVDISAENLNVEWSLEGESGGGSVELIPDTENDRNCTVKVGNSENLEDYGVIVKASIYRNGEDLGFQYYIINATSCYYFLEPVSIDTEIGQDESTEIKGLGLYLYEVGKEKKLIPKARFSFQYDENVLEVTDSNGGVIKSQSYEEEPTIQAGDFVIKRIGTDADWLYIRAWIPDEDGNWSDMGSREWYFDWCSTEDVNFNETEVTIFTSSDYDEGERKTLCVNTGNLKNYSIEWEVALYGNERDEYGNSVSVVADPASYSTSGNEITLDADKLKAEFAGKGMESEQLQGFVRANIKKGDSYVAEAYATLEINTPVYRISGLEDVEKDVVKGYMAYMVKETECYVRNQKNPYGNYFQLIIQGVVIDNPEGAEAVWELQDTDADADYYNLKAVGYGEASLTVETSSEELGERNFTIHTNVVDEIYSLEIDMQGWSLLPGELKQMKVGVMHDFYDEESGEIKDEKIKDTGAFTVDFESESELLTVKNDGTVTASKLAKENQWCQIQVTLTVPREGKEPYVYVEKTGVNICMGHKFVKTGTGEAASCNEEGYVEWECTECGMIKTETVPKTSHSFVETRRVPASCTAKGSVTKKCSRCGETKTEVLPKTGHSFGAWSTTTEPTALEEGVQTRTCKVCKTAETKNINKLKATIKLNVKSITLKVKQSTTAIEVTTAKGDGVKSWKSSNTKVASVTSKGKITGKKAGTAKITVTLKSGVKATINVKVQKNAVVTSKLTVTGQTAKIKGNKLTLKKGKSETLVAVLTPITSQQKITYKTSNKKIVTVNSKGKITAKKPGKAKITVQSGKKKVVVTVTVKK